MAACEVHARSLLTCICRVYLSINANVFTCIPCLSCIWMQKVPCDLLLSSGLTHHSASETWSISPGILQEDLPATSNWKSRKWKRRRKCQWMWTGSLSKQRRWCFKRKLSAETCRGHFSWWSIGFQAHYYQRTARGLQRGLQEKGKWRWFGAGGRGWRLQA